ncbi:MAG: hypothetical protein NUV98_00900 [Candidatus Roizmanbacteria bacterium]|nr:hypothetical protein [Candidatus Roizmanbacteria bacterium]
MNKEEARAQLGRFLGDNTLTFRFETFETGEWIATGNEIPAIQTGGMNSDITTIDSMLREAILVAAGIDPKYKNDILNFVGIEQKRRPAIGWFSDSSRPATRSAEYVLL